MADRQRSRRVPRSIELYERATELIPGGTQLVSRRPNRAALWRVAHLCRAGPRGPILGR